MDFEEYLIDKKINSVAFKKGDAEMWNDFKNQFEQMHPKNFTAQKLFLINGIRRKYTLMETEAIEKKVVTTAKRPVIKTGKSVINKPEVPGAGEVKKPARPVMKRPKMK
jgi:hypothetical protein